MRTGNLLWPPAYPAAVQLALDVPQGVTVTLSFERDEDAPALEDLTVYLRAGAPVGYAAADGDVVVTADATIDDASSPIVLQPAPSAGLLHVGLASRGSGDGFVEVQATIEEL